jgi:hypothetical protein
MTPDAEIARRGFERATALLGQRSGGTGAGPKLGDSR